MDSEKNLDAVKRTAKELADSHKRPTSMSPSGEFGLYSSACGGKVNKAVIVLGMFRSGTSLVGNLLYELGAFVETDKFPPNSLNEKGYWESAEVSEINIQLLNSIGSDEFHPSAMFPNRWDHESEEFATLRDRMRSYVNRMSGHDFWAFKHPPTSLTLPLWYPFLPPDRAFIICVRNPLSVARSMKKWNFDEYRSSQLWIAYNLSALANTANQRRLFVFYEDFISNPASEVQRIGSFLNIEIKESPLKVYSEGLHHYKVTNGELLSDEDVPWGAKILYLTLLESKRKPELLVGLTRELVEAQRLNGLPMFAKGEEKLPDLRRLEERYNALRAQYETMANHPYIRFGRRIKRLLG